MIYYFPGIEGMSVPDYCIAHLLPPPVRYTTYPHWSDMVRTGGGLDMFAPPITDAPTAFVGHSLGGIVAYSVARHYPGVPLIILDTDLERYVGSPARPARDRTTFAARARQVRHAPTHAARVRRAVTLALDATTRAPLVASATRPLGQPRAFPRVTLPAGLESSLRWTLRRDMAEVWIRENPPAPENVTLFRTSDHPAEASRHLGWGQTARVVSVSGDHVSMLIHPKLPGLIADALRVSA